MVPNLPKNFDEDDKTDPNLVLPPRPTFATPAVRMPDLGVASIFMNDPSVSEVMINDTRNIMLEKDGKLVFSGVNVATLEELNRITRSIVEMTGRILSPDQPYLDVMLPDGSRANIITAPLTQNGPCLTIRKFPTQRYSMEDLVAMEMMDKRTAYFLSACVVGKMNILISGGTNSGKTTLLNALAQMIPPGERLITIEDTPELVITHSNSVKLQTKPNTAVSPAITSRELVANSLRMRPDRIIVGECRRGEAFDTLQAMNTGHAGSMTTIHANSPRDGLSRLETLCLMSGVDIPLIAIRRQMNSALDLIVQLKRFRSGRRRVTSVVELTGIESDTITLQEIFMYETDPKNPVNSDAGRFKCTGFVPTFLDRLADQGVELAKNYFS